MSFFAIYMLSLVITALGIRLTMTNKEIDNTLGGAMVITLIPAVNTVFSFVAIAILIMKWKKS